MPVVVKVGRRGDQPFQIGDPQVSSYHAELRVSDSGDWTLIDTRSTNGTYVFQNGDFRKLPVGQPCRIKPDDMIRLGPVTRFHAKKLAPNAPTPQTPKAPPPPKTIEIANLQRVEDIYKSNKRHLEAKLNSINGYRSFTILISIIISTLGSMLPKMLDIDEKNQLWVIIASIAIGALLMCVLLYVINNKSKKYRYELEENEKQYSIRYCCPECRLPFKGKYFENIIAEGSCPKCKTKFTYNPPMEPYGRIG